MYCGTGLINLGFIPKSPKNLRGPDFSFQFNRTRYFVECVAPCPGDNIKADSLQDNKFTNNVVVNSLPENPFLFRLSTSLDDKAKKYKKYLEENTASKNDVLLIAVSSCFLRQIGSMMNFPVLAIDKVLYGIGCLAININTGVKHLTKREELVKENGAKIEVDLFGTKKYSHISGVIYSYDDPINPHDKPEDSFSLSINNNANNQIVEEFYSLFTHVSR
jgi:hypothetical protein